MTEHIKNSKIQGYIHRPYGLWKKSPCLILNEVGKRFTEVMLDKSTKLTEIYLLYINVYKNIYKNYQQPYFGHV